MCGSSPHARGLLADTQVDQGPERIIPARAGFTWCAPPWLWGPRVDHPRTRGVYRQPTSQRHGHADHPRTRGVYVIDNCPERSVYGSSPHARGLLRRAPSFAVTLRIIPARAGFTVDVVQEEGEISDHPRTRGVYALRQRLAGAQGGSSPHARGLRKSIREVAEGTGIIPARAGFTPPGRPGLGVGVRIIPARAGFTSTGH